MSATTEQAESANAERGTHSFGVNLATASRSDHSDQTRQLTP